MDNLTQIQNKLAEAIKIQDKAIQEWVAMDKRDPMYYTKGQEVMDLHKGVISLINAEKEEKSSASIGDYWEGKGKYQKEYDRIWKEQVPAKGESDIEYVEAVRCMGRLIYEYCNNGNGNSVDYNETECDECGGSGYMYDDDGTEEDCSGCGGDCYVKEERYITDYYEECLEKVRWFTKEHQLIADLKRVMLARENSFSATERKPYNLLCDAVMRCAMLIK